MGGHTTTMVAQDEAITSGAARFRASRAAPTMLQEGIGCPSNFDITEFKVEESHYDITQDRTQAPQAGQQQLVQQKMGHLTENPNASTPLYQSEKYGPLFQTLEGKANNRAHTDSVARPHNHSSTGRTSGKKNMQAHRNEISAQEICLMTHWG